MNRFLLLVVILTSTYAQFQDSCETATYEKIKECYVEYFRGYDIIMEDIIPEYWSFHGNRKKLIDNHGLNIQPYICHLGNALSSCVSKYPCMGPNAYVYMNAANSTEATDYWIDLAVTEYQCGVGYNLTMSEFYCVAFCRDRHQSDMDNCDYQMKINMENGMDKCVAQQTDFNCQSEIYRKCCDWNAAVYICNVNLSGSRAVDPTCYDSGQLQCPNPI